MKSLLSSLFLSASALLCATASADTRLTLDLNWVNLPRTDAHLLVNKLAVVPGAKIVYRLFDDGDRMFSIFTEDGGRYSSLVPKGVRAVLICGTEKEWYELIQAPGKMTHVELVKPDVVPSGKEVTQ